MGEGLEITAQSFKLTTHILPVEVIRTKLKVLRNSNVDMLETLLQQTILSDIQRAEQWHKLTFRKLSLDLPKGFNSAQRGNMHFWSKRNILEVQKFWLQSSTSPKLWSV